MTIPYTPPIVTPRRGWSPEEPSSLRPHFEKIEDFPKSYDELRKAEIRHFFKDYKFRRWIAADPNYFDSAEFKVWCGLKSRVLRKLKSQKRKSK